MSIESIKARMEEHDRQRERFGYCDETAPQIWERDLRALLKVAEAAKEWKRAKGASWINHDFSVALQAEAKLAAALTELEAQE